MSDRNEDNLPEDDSSEAGPPVSAADLESEAMAKPAPKAEATSDGEGAGAARTLGLERYVQFGFIALGGVLFWVLDKVITAVWTTQAEPNTFVITLLSLALGGGIALAISRHPTVSKTSHEVAVELSKVTWPTKDETYAATVVVIVTSIIAAVLVGSFDAIWSFLTDKLYAM